MEVSRFRFCSPARKKQQRGQAGVGAALLAAEKFSADG